MEEPSFLGAVRSTFANSYTFLTALPLLALLIVGAEGLQHLVEWRDGMYAGKAGLAAAASDPHRLLAGSVKVAWLLLVQFWVVRYVVGGSVAAVVRPTRRAVAEFGLLMLLMLALALPSIWLPTLLPAHSSGRKLVASCIGVVQLVSFPLGIAFTPWVVGAALGDQRAGPIFALRRAWGSIWWSVGLTLAAVIFPLMLFHYVLSFLAVGRPAFLTAVILVIDAFVVGYLGVVLGAVNVPIAARMASRAGDQLVVDPA